MNDDIVILREALGFKRADYDTEAGKAAALASHAALDLLVARLEAAERDALAWHRNAVDLQREFAAERQRAERLAEALRRIADHHPVNTDAGSMARAALADFLTDDIEELESSEGV